MDMQERSQQQLRERLSLSQENEQILTIELEEKRKELEDVRHELDIVRAQLEEVEIKLAPDPLPAGDEQEEAVTVHAAAETLNDYTNDYLHQLKAAQEKLVEHNNSIYRLLEHTHLVEESERRNQELLRRNEDLNEELHNNAQLLVEKETEISNLRHQQKLSEEMTQRLDKVYDEYNTLQEKLQKLQSYLTQPHSRGTDYDGLKEAYFKL
ncbi:hypothetical protein GP486_008822, partial [Trichoglossum hirsutum]